MDCLAPFPPNVSTTIPVILRNAVVASMVLQSANALAITADIAPNARVLNTNLTTEFCIIPVSMLFIAVAALVSAIEK